MQVACRGWVYRQERATATVRVASTLTMVDLCGEAFSAAETVTVLNVGAGIRDTPAKDQDPDPRAQGCPLSGPPIPCRCGHDVCLERRPQVCRELVVYLRAHRWPPCVLDVVSRSPSGAHPLADAVQPGLGRRFVQP
jgi:hypothetical protein